MCFEIHFFLFRAPRNISFFTPSPPPPHFHRWSIDQTDPNCPSKWDALISLMRGVIINDLHDAGTSMTVVHRIETVRLCE